MKLDSQWFIHRFKIGGGEQTEFRQMFRVCKCRSVARLMVAATVCLTGIFVPLPAFADTLESALIQAYQNNPSLNSQRAATRAIDEGVPQALSGYRPKVTVTAQGGEQSLSSTAKTGGIVPGTPLSYLTQSGY